MSASAVTDAGAPGQRKTRLVVLGGFLGAGKTTTLLRLAREIVARGQTVGVVTNDQGEELVDTGLFRAAGFATRDVRGGCFCCRLDDLLEQARVLASSAAPDYLLAEPVGSCTDLVATVLRPLATLHSRAFMLAPYCVLVDPLRALDALSPRGAASLSEKVTYIFRLQQMEADTLVVSKTDLVAPGIVDEVESLLAAQFPRKRILRMSAVTGDGFDAFESLLLESGHALPASPDIDYDTYAEGEAELAWFDGRYRVAGPAQPLQGALVQLAHVLRERLASAGAPVVHLKLHAGCDDGNCAVNVASASSEPIVSVASPVMAECFDLIVNARAQGDAGMLARVVKQSMVQWVRGRARLDAVTEESFSPARPVPTVRLD